MRASILTLTLLIFDIVVVSAYATLAVGYCIGWVETTWWMSALMAFVIALHSLDKMLGRIILATIEGYPAKPSTGK